MLTETGLILAFDDQVDFTSLILSQPAFDPDRPMQGVSRAFELLVPVQNAFGDTSWDVVTRLTCEALESVDITDGIASNPTPNPADGDILVPAVRLVMTEVQFREVTAGRFIPEWRIVFRSDLANGRDDLPVDGNFIGARLPTGNGRAGGLFESWFRVDG